MSVRERLVPAVAGAAVLMVALMVVALLRSAANDGTDALENAKVAQVRTTADSFNARVESSISSLGGLGARPWELKRGSAADQAGLKDGDVILEFEGKKVPDADSLIVAIRARNVGDTVKMKVQRGNQTVDVTMTLQAASG